jgi:hypothetical protein
VNYVDDGLGKEPPLLTGGKSQTMEDAQMMDGDGNKKRGSG